ncbi:cytochrome P450 6g1-like [Eupeodes corollae]|uniref:cytochrome P450 6g1-like n=1 Tax=Eupeodes corollae TaxID=290404 RepID=UPI0024935706|nr:cytochrome P450 6g1-like [Eupeodes corollae]
MALSILLLVLIVTLTIFYLWMKNQYSYWKKKNIPYIKPFPLIGSLKEILTMTSCPAEQLAAVCNDKSVKNHPAFGIYLLNRPILVIKDPALSKLILIKEFNKFSDRFASADPHGDPLAFNNLFFLKGAPWREMRTKVTPVFTSGKLKQMFPLIEEIGFELNEYLCRLTKDNKTSMQEIKEISALFGTDVIASVAFGMYANCLKDENSDFRRNGKPIFKWNTMRAYEFIVMFFFPQLVKLFRAKLFPTEATKFLVDSISFVMADRAKSRIPRNDLIDILVKIKETSEAEGEDLDKKKLIAQAAVFFAAGFETSSSIISFGLHELSRKPELQKRLREEIKESLLENDGKTSYESLNAMKYLDMVVLEVLRMYPPQPFLDRICTLPKGEEEFSLRPHIDLSIPHGMPVFFPLLALQRDPKFFPNPDEFDPERFSPENKPKIIPFSYMPFGVGPHNCIGERLGVFQSKMGIVNFLRSHYVEPCEKSHEKIKLDPKGLLLSAKGGIYVNLVRDSLIC